MYQLKINRGIMLEDILKHDVTIVTIKEKFLFKAKSIAIKLFGEKFNITSRYQIEVFSEDELDNIPEHFNFLCYWEKTYNDGTTEVKSLYHNPEVNKQA